MRARGRTLAADVEGELWRQNRECAHRQGARRLGPICIVRICRGSWSEFQKRRLARSGGAVEQSEQPHLIPDPEQMAAFQVAEPVG
jgi:hypothetical protein